jgi:beta-lactamase class A
VLARVDAGREWLDRQVAYDQRDLLDYAPVTTAHVADGQMTLADLCAAAVEVSDNTAANLILASLSGPAGVTRYVRALGDETTRLDHTEPALNRPGPPSDPSDTTTPASMVGLWRKLLLENALSTASRDHLTGWLEAAQTGAGSLKAAVPPGWRIGHKTGTGRTTIGDVAILTPPDQRPVLIAVYLDIPAARENTHDQAIAQAGRAALAQLASHAR